MSTIDLVHWGNTDRLRNIEANIAALQAANANMLGVGLGIQFDPFPASSTSSQTAPTTQTIFGLAVAASVGATITGIEIRNGVAAAGTLPTTARFGLLDSTGKVLVLSGNVNATASWPTGPCRMPFTAPFTLAYTGIYFPCFVVNGVWGTTQPTPILCNSATGAAFSSDGAFPPAIFSQTGQTDLPAVGGSVTITGAGNRAYYLALY